VIHGLASESANGFDLEAFAVLSSFAEAHALAPKAEVLPPAAPVARPAPADKGISALRLAALTSLFFAFGAIGPIMNAVRSFRAEPQAAPGVAVAMLR
jgi:hypothetical protein